MRISDWSSDVCSSDLQFGFYRRRFSACVYQYHFKRAGLARGRRRGGKTNGQNRGMDAKRQDQGDTHVTPAPGCAARGVECCGRGRWFWWIQTGNRRSGGNRFNVPAIQLQVQFVETRNVQRSEEHK